ncbi:MAG TPA: hypothetical protein VFN67_40065 [Polyangiales bacterium]|nr:hypothetical protein [Polyangiales bacterium]
MLSSVLYRTTRRLIGAVDLAVLERVLTPLPAAMEPIESLSHTERMHALAAFAAFYDRPEHLAQHTKFFTRLGQPEPRQRVIRRYRRDGDVIDLSWASGFESLWSERSAAAHFAALEAKDAPLARSIRSLNACESRLGIQVRYAHARPENQTMHARWFKHRAGPRPCAVILHGYLGGTLAVEEVMWPIQALFDRGMDVVLTVLPMHGPRTGVRDRFRLPGFPAVDPRLAVEGFRQLVHDHLTLFDYLLDSQVNSLGLMGMSLGGYSAALLSTLDPRIRFSVFYMPLASVSEFALRTGRMVGSEQEQLEQASALERVYRCVSPLARPSLLPHGHSLVIAGESDLITGKPHSDKLVNHFNSAVSTFAGGHILQLGRDAAFDAVWELLDRAT